MEGPEDRPRHLHRKVVLLQQSVVPNEHTMLLFGNVFNLLGNHVTPPVRIHDHAGFFQRLLIGSEIPDAYRAAGREETMADGRISGRQPRELEPDGPAAVESYKPADRTRKPDLRRVPPHCLRT